MGIMEWLLGANPTTAESPERAEVTILSGFNNVTKNPPMASCTPLPSSASSALCLTIGCMDIITDVYLLAYDLKQHGSSIFHYICRVHPWYNGIRRRRACRLDRWCTGFRSITCPTLAVHHLKLAAVVIYRQSGRQGLRPPHKQHRIFRSRSRSTQTHHRRRSVRPQLRAARIHLKTNSHR